MEDEIVGDVVETTDLKPDDKPPAETPPEKTHEPPVDSPRWKEMVWKMREFERQSKEKDETIAAIVDHNKSLQESMDGLYDKVSVSERPDAITDPEGHDKWLSDKIKRDIKKDQTTPEIKPVPKKTGTKVQEQAGIMKAVVDDFDEVITFANEFLKTDKMTRIDIANSENPPRALYEYGLKKKDELGEKRTADLNQALVEGGSTPPANIKTVPLTEEQERARIGLGISTKDYIKQRDFIDSRKGA